MTLRLPIFARIALLVILALAVLYLAAFLVVTIPLLNARTNWRKSNEAAAIETLESWQRLRVRSHDFDHLRAVVYLSSGKTSEARPVLDRLSRRGEQRISFLPKEEVGKRLIDAGRYNEFLLYDAAYRRSEEAADSILYRTVAQLATGKIKDATASFGGIDPAAANPEMYAAVRKAVRERSTGGYALVFDRDGKTIAFYHAGNADLVTVNEDFETLIDKTSGVYTIEANLRKLGTNDALHTTLDAEIQRAGIRALGAFRGSLVAISIPDNELLAVVSTPGKGSRQNIAFEEQYEPGSVIKTLTALSSFESGIDLQKIFPLNCGGFIVLNRRQFFCWARHGTVLDVNEGMATSCNVAFGKMGLELGAERLRKFMKTAGFDSTADLGLMTVPLGKNLGELNDDYAVASYAVGLEKERTNSLHIAMLAAMIANKGKLITPRLLRSRRSILGVSTEAAVTAAPVTVASEASVLQVIPAMRAVVDHPRGSGRRSRIPGFPIAMKTGTAGDGRYGYDSVIMAFAPADAPRIAVGIIAESAGPAELAGAQIARSFFSQVQPLLQ